MDVRSRGNHGFLPKKGAEELMKAIVFHQHGEPDVLKFEDVAEPTIRPNEVLVRVKACALNHLDLWVRRGIPGVPIPLPHIPGSDVSGEIAQIGADVTTVRVGQKVVLAPGVTCGKCAACVSGQDNRCRQFTNLGYMIDGGYAEFVRAPEVNCLPYPENLSFEEAASIPLVFQTAKFIGARVIAIASSDEKLEKAKELGADHLINHKTQKIREEVRRITNKRGVDVVFEHVGTATWDGSLASLAAGGRRQIETRRRSHLSARASCRRPRLSRIQLAIRQSRPQGLVFL